MKLKAQVKLKVELKAQVKVKLKVELQVNLSCQLFSVQDLFGKTTELVPVSLLVLGSSVFVCICVSMSVTFSVFVEY